MLRLLQPRRDTLLARWQDRSGSPGRPSIVKAAPPSTMTARWRRSVVRGFRRGRRAAFAVAIVIGVVAFTLGVVGYLRGRRRLGGDRGVRHAAPLHPELRAATRIRASRSRSRSRSPASSLRSSRCSPPSASPPASSATSSTGSTTRHRVRGHVIVCGLGHVGSTAVALLRAHGHRVVAIERDRSCVRRSRRRDRSACRWWWVTPGPPTRSSGRGSRGRRA